MIQIVYRTGEEDLVTPKFMDILLYLGQIQMFKRSGGWIVVGVDRLRGSQPVPYNGADQRLHKQTPLPESVSAEFLSRHI